MNHTDTNDTADIALSIVIPVYNEEENVAELLRRTLAAGRKLQRPFEIILIDDGSRDASPQLLKEAAKQQPEVIALLLNRNYGQHAAVFAGLQQSRGDIVVTLDADLQNPPEEIARLVDEIEKGADVVGSIRKDRRDSLFRCMASALINRMVQKSTGILMHDYGCMLRAYRRDIVNAMLECREHSTFIPILANSFAAKTAEITVAHQQRENGTSKYNLYKLVALQFDLMTSISTFPLRLLTLFGTFLFLTGAGLGVLSCIFPETGWSFALFAAVIFFVGLQFIGMGLLGEYLGRIYIDVRGRPRYHIARIWGA